MRDTKGFLNLLAKEAGEILLANFGRAKEAARKGEIDLVTEADLASQRLIVEAIRQRYPDHTILSEEAPRLEGKSEFTWLIDPLDGTINYFHGYPAFAISIALKEREEITLGAVYDPLRDEFFYAQKGEGATLNDKGVKVSTTHRLISSLLATGFPYQRVAIPDNNVPEFSRLVTRVQGIRRGGSAALDLAYVAAGRLDGYWEMHLSPWDWAGGGLLVEEAGGVVTDLEGGPWSPFKRGIVATNGRIHEELISELKAAADAVRR
ncbi:MAG TPA: inositol monophosphatase [Chloroflexi bacterium]|nr:inositol monophosphatase [Chloroflexota bacterium]